MYYWGNRRCRTVQLRLARRQLEADRLHHVVMVNNATKRWTDFRLIDGYGFECPPLLRHLYVSV